MLRERDYIIVEALPLYTAEAERDPGIIGSQLSVPTPARADGFGLGTSHWAEMAA